MPVAQLASSDEVWHTLALCVSEGAGPAASSQGSNVLWYTSCVFGCSTVVQRRTCYDERVVIGVYWDESNILLVCQLDVWC